jgi:hypothetical protein
LISARAPMIVRERTSRGAGPVGCSPVILPALLWSTAVKSLRRQEAPAVGRVGLLGLQGHRRIPASSVSAGSAMSASGVSKKISKDAVMNRTLLPLWVHLRTRTLNVEKAFNEGWETRKCTRKGTVKTHSRQSRTHGNALLTICRRSSLQRVW